MSKTASPLHTKRIPKSVSQPTVTAEAAATVAESSVALEPVAATSKSRPKKGAVIVKKPRAAAVADDAVAARTAKAHKPKLVRDSFTIPKDEYLVLNALKTRALGLEQHVRKSELLRAGVQALNAMGDRAFLKAIGAVPTLKTGRPKID